jgi:hypothetical protein
MAGAGSLGHGQDLLPGYSLEGARRFATISCRGGLRLRAGVRHHRAHSLDELRRDVVAPALGAEHLLQAPLEVGMAGARGAFPEVTLDLHALDAHELPVEIELDLAEHVLALSR